MRQHLEICEGCAREFRFEASVLGNVRAKLDIRGGVGSLPSLPQGIYVIRTADAIARRGVVQVVP